MSKCIFCGEREVTVPAMGWKGDVGIGMCDDCAKQLEQSIGVVLTRIPDETKSDKD